MQNKKSEFTDYLKNSDDGIMQMAKAMNLFGEKSGRDKR